MTPEPLLAPFTEKGKEVSSGYSRVDTRTENQKQVEQPGTNGEWSCDRYLQHRSYCIWPLEGVRQKSCDQCAAQKIVCTVSGVRVSNRKRRDRSGPEGSRPQKKSRVEVEESDAESDWSGLGGKKDPSWRQEVSSALVEIQELLREQNGLLRRIAQGSDGGLGTGNEEAEDSTIRE